MFAVLLYASDPKMPPVHWRAAGALHTFLALLVMELAEAGSTCTLSCHSLLHTWGLPVLSLCTSDEAGESNLRPSKHFAQVTSTVPDDTIHECLTHELYMKLLHTSATRRQLGGMVAYGAHNGGPSFSSLAFLELLKCGAMRMVHVLTLWSVIGDATMYIDTSAHNLKLGLPGVQGRSDVRRVFAQCAQVQSTKRHSEPCDLSMF